jgi:hypothetical protein
MLLPTASVGNLPPRKVEPITPPGGENSPFAIHIYPAPVKLNGKQVAEVTFKHKSDLKARR